MDASFYVQNERKEWGNEQKGTPGGGARVRVVEGPAFLRIKVKKMCHFLPLFSVKMTKHDRKSKRAGPVPGPF